MGKNFKLHIRAAITVILLCGFINIPHASAQAKQKPELVPVVLNEKTNDPKAVAIIEKIDPEYFDIKIPKNINNPIKHIARLIKYNENTLLFYKASDYFFLCGKMGCPHKVYMNTTKNNWRLVGQFMTHNIFYDKNSKNTTYPNIITQDFDYAQGTKPSVYIWNNSSYFKVTK